MPVGRTASRREITAIAFALGGVLVAVLVGAVMLLVARGGDVEVRLGSDVWEVGRSSRLAAAIADDGPFAVLDLSGGDRDIYVSHVGEDTEQGWYASAARATGSARECSVAWDADDQVLRDPCTQVAFPPDGRGLEQYPVRVEDGQVTVDINRVLDQGPGGEDPPPSVVESGIPKTQS